MMQVTKTWIVCAALMVVVACDKQGGETTDPAKATASASERADAAPPWTQSTYVSGSKDDDAGDDAKADPSEDKADEAEPDKPDDGKLRDLDEVRDIAAEAANEVLDPYAPTIMSPTLVTAWPSTEAKVMYIIYPLTPSKASSTTFSVGAPVKVTVSLLDGSTEVEQLAKSGRFKSHEDKRFPSMEQDEVSHAEQMVLELVLGEREYAKAAGYLEAYELWFVHYGKVAADLRARAPDAIEWHRNPHP